MESDVTYSPLSQSSPPLSQSSPPPLQALNNSEIPPMFILTDLPLSYSTVVYGYMCPPAAIASIILNALVIITMLQQKMRSPTNYILAAIALTDLLTAAVLLPFFFHLYTLNGYKEYPTLWMCRIFWPMFRAVPSVLRTASVWLSALLVIYRYVNVNAIPSRRRTTSQAIIYIIAIVYLLSVFSSITRFFEVRLRIFNVPGDPNKRETCQLVWQQWIVESMPLYFNMYYICKAILGYLVPCLLLFVFNLLLIQTVYQAQLKRKRLLAAADLPGARRVLKSYRTTIMLLVVIVFTLLSEVPRTVVFSLASFQSIARITNISKHFFRASAIIMNLITIVTCSLNFLIYYTMSRSFRLHCNSVLLCTKSSMFRRVKSSRMINLPSPLLRHHDNTSKLPSSNFNMITVQRKSYSKSISE